MHKISDLAKLFNVSTKTVRLYEELGLITNSVRDPINNYRYFNELSAYELSIVLDYKKLGFTLVEISSILAGNFSFSTHMEQLLEEQRIIENKLTNISAFSTNYLGNNPNILNIPQTSVLFLSLKSNNLNHFDAFSHLIAQAINENLELSSTSSFFSISKITLSNNILSAPQDSIVCLAMIDGQSASENFMILPANKFASIVYTGPYCEISEAHSYLYNFAVSNYDCTPSTIYECFLSKPSENTNITTVRLMMPIS